MTDRTDDRLMTDYVGGDENALRIIVERWERPVFAFLVRMLGSPEEAEDLCQDSFMKLIKAADRYRPEGKFQSWLFRIAGNQARSRLRRRKILRWLPLTDDYDNAPARDPDALTDLTGKEERDLVQEAVARLPERQRQALVLKQYHDLSYQEIADTMGTTVASVQMLLHRGMSALRKDLAARRDEG
ncbi:MAG: sigma-70 family RNA polymerase sigma factor [bacterium]|nr:sigma-70 family RNA polymerase sigma factor [bacterium]